MPRGISLPRWPITPDHPDWPTCQCGCGKKVLPYHRGVAAKGILNGQPHEYARGCTSRRKMRNNGTEKCCGKCKKYKPLDEFRRRGSGKWTSNCKSCLNGSDKSAAREWRKANPEWYAADNRRRQQAWRARKAGARFVEHIDELIVLERDDGICGICGLDVNPLDFTVDHTVPMTRGGDHAYYNVRVAHKSCNSRKKDKLDSEM